MHQCSIRHGWDRIPFTMEPIHEAQDGDSFVVAVTSWPEATRTPVASSSSGLADHRCDHDMGENDDHDMPEDDPDSPVPSPSVLTNSPQPSSSSHSPYMSSTSFWTHPVGFG